MREAGARELDINRMQAWAGQSAALARAEPAGDIVRRVWREAEVLLPKEKEGTVSATAHAMQVLPWRQPPR
jgi:hypothetical protein